MFDFTSEESLKSCLEYTVYYRILPVANSNKFSSSLEL